MASIESWVVYAYSRHDPNPLHEKAVWTMGFSAATEEEAIRQAQLSNDYEPVLAELATTSDHYRRQATKVGFEFTRWRLNHLLEERSKLADPLPKVAEAKPIGLPPEAHTSAKFDPDLAWRATRIAAGDPPPGE